VSEDDFTWGTEAPVEEIELADACRKALELKAYVEQWRKDHRTEKERTPGAPTEAQIQATLGMCDVIRQTARSGQTAFLYEICGVPAGIVVLGKSDGYEHVDSLVTHPAAAFAASIMLEFLLTRAAKAGRPPVIRLSWHYQSSKDAFEAFGFVVKDEFRCHMALDARQSKEWTLTDGAWKYVSSRPTGPEYAMTQKLA
jgi:hypothetical protein